MRGVFFFDIICAVIVVFLSETSLYRVDTKSCSKSASRFTQSELRQLRGGPEVLRGVAKGDPTSCRTLPGLVCTKGCFEKVIFVSSEWKVGLRHSSNR